MDCYVGKGLIRILINVILTPSTNNYDDYLYYLVAANLRYFKFMNIPQLPNNADVNDCHKM